MSLYLDIEKRLGAFTLCIKLQAEDEILALLGASGSGKSLTLRCIAGIERPDRGKIIIDGETVFDSEAHINLPPQKRRVGLMFQNYALFPNMTVLQNVLQGAGHIKDRKERLKRAQEMLARFSLSDYQHHYPHQLSGGQQQRSALARMLLSEPRLLLLDEPFSALDTHLRLQSEQELSQILREYGKTVLYVSHERNEVYRLCHSIAVLHDGKLAEQAEKHALFTHPQTIHAAKMLGWQNISRAQAISSARTRAIDWGMEFDIPLDDANTFFAVPNRAVSLSSANGTACTVLSQMEQPDSFCVCLSPIGVPNARLYCEIPKPLWEALPHDTIRAEIGRASIITLRGEQV